MQHQQQETNDYIYDNYTFHCNMIIINIKLLYNLKQNHI